MLKARDIERPFTYFYADEPRRAIIISVDEYAGEEELIICCTQLEQKTQSEKKKILNEWIDFLSADIDVFTRLEFCSRVPQRYTRY